MITFKDWVSLIEQNQNSLLSQKVSPADKDDNDELENQAKLAIASTVGQPGINAKMRATQLRRIAQTGAGKKGVKLKSVLKLANTADELAKQSNNNTLNANNNAQS